MGKQVKVKEKKGVFQIFSGIALISLIFLLNGLLSLIPIGFDFSKIKTMGYWANFIILFASEMGVVFGMFIIQKVKDLENPKIVDLQNCVDDSREKIYYLDKVAEAEKWLRDIYNYREKLILFENAIKKIHSNITLEEPEKDDKHYQRKLKKYLKLKEKNEFCLTQFEFIKKDKERIALLLVKDKSEEQLSRLELLEKDIDSKEYIIKKSKIHYKEVYWGCLLSDMEESKNNNGSPYFNEKKELTKNLLKYFAFGVITSSFMASIMFPAINNFKWSTIISVLINLITLSFFILKGITLSHTIILGNYYRALEKRKAIYNQMLKDLGLSKIVIEEKKDNESV